ncbi:MAG: 2TM domain-containing protein [Fimbriimonadaceae bacterium]
MPHEFYDEDEAEAILRLAARRGATGGMTREALLRVAGEVGISPEAVEEAERQLAGQREEVDLAAEFRRRQRVDFTERLATYVGTSAFMVGIWFFTGRGFFWPAFVILALTLGIATDIPKYLFVGGSSYQHAFARWKSKRERRALEAAKPDDA